MSELFDDISTAFNEARFQMADDFKHVREDNMKAYRRTAQAWVDAVYQNYGDDGAGSIATYSVAFFASVGDVLIDFVQNVADATLVDPLRLGQGVKKGTAGGYLEDSMRVMGVVGGAIKLVRFGRFMLASNELRGGLMSCTPSSGARALLHAAVKSAPTVEEVAKGTGAGISLRLPTYPGAFIQDVVPNLQKAGASFKNAQINSVQDVIALVDKREGPVLFSVAWKGGNAHTMMAYKPFFGSGVRLADQLGNLHTFQETNKVFSVVAGPGTSAKGLIGATASFKAGQPLGQIAAVFPQAVVMKDAALLQVEAALPLINKIGLPLYLSLNDQFNHKIGYAASMLPTAPPRLMKVGESVRKAIAALPPENAGPTPPVPAATATPGPGMPANANMPPSRAGTLSSTAKRLLDLVGPPRSTIQGKVLWQKAMAANIDSLQYHPLLDELERAGAVRIQRSPMDTLTIFSVTRN